MNIGTEQVYATQQRQSQTEVENLRNLDYRHMDKQKIKQVSQEFESLFVNELFKSMRGTVPKDDWLNGGLKQDIFEDMLYNKYAEMTSESGGVGLSDMIYKFLTQSYSENSAGNGNSAPQAGREA